MVLRLATATRNTAIDSNGNMLNAGTIQIRTVAQPATVETAAGGVLLGTVGFGATAFGAAATGVKTANAISSGTAVASGTAQHARLVTSAGAIHSDADVAQGSGSISFDNATVVSGGIIAISSLTLSQPI